MALGVAISPSTGTSAYLLKGMFNQKYAFAKGTLLRSDRWFSQGNASLVGWGSQGPVLRQAASPLSAYVPPSIKYGQLDHEIFRVPFTSCCSFLSWAPNFAKEIEPSSRLLSPQVQCPLSGLQGPRRPGAVPWNSGCLAGLDF